jgi:hypothetical protein
MNVLFEVGSEFVPPRAIQNMVTVIAEGVGTEESAEEDDKMRTYCVDSFFEITEKKPVIHDLHLQVSTNRFLLLTTKGYCLGTWRVWLLVFSTLT